MGRRISAKMTPNQKNIITRSVSVLNSRTGAKTLLSSSAPTPKPMTTTPVASPFRSGNHFATVATGVT